MATVTITTTSQQDQRIAPAVGSILGLGRDATINEVKQWLIAYLRANVLDYERRVDAQSFIPNPLDPT